MNTTKSYAERQAEWVKANGIKVGDKVIVRRAAESYENEWKGEWQPGMDMFVNREAEVDTIGDRPGQGIRICSDKVKWYFPFFVLEPVPESPWKEYPKEKPTKNGHYHVWFRESGGILNWWLPTESWWSGSVNLGLAGVTAFIEIPEPPPYIPPKPEIPEWIIEKTPCISGDCLICERCHASYCCSNVSQIGKRDEWITEHSKCPKTEKRWLWEKTPEVTPDDAFVRFIRTRNHRATAPGKLWRKVPGSEIEVNIEENKQ